MKQRTITIAACLAVLSCSGPGSASRDDQKPVSEPERAVEAEPAPEPGLHLAESVPEASPHPTLEAMSDEVSRAMDAFAGEEHPPYFVSLQVSDRRSRSISAADGAVDDVTRDRGRTLDIEVRVGSPELDNTHELRGQWRGDYAERSDALAPWDDLFALRRAIWRMTEERYRHAVGRYLEVLANRGVRAEEADDAGDFSDAPVIDHIEPLQQLETDTEAWRARIARLSSLPKESDEIHTLSVTYEEELNNRWQVTTEGSRVQKSRRVARLAWYASTRADDGMHLWLYDSIDLYDPSRMPSDEELRRRIEKTVELTLALREAPTAEPYVGPAILEGEAAGVFFHEALGHRVEGHRQSDEDEGQTFARKLGDRVLPEFLSVYDDPRAQRLDGVDLMGHYLVDDEAVRTTRAHIVTNGVLEGFLMSRDPAWSFDSSNGHGRREPGKHVVARQGNLVIQPSRALSRDELTKRLVSEAQAQGNEYGLRIVKVRGGYTFTGRSIPQSFRILPLVVYRVHPDGTEELIRGVNFDGTPLTVLSEITAASKDYGVFNGVCGAESGHVPVSSVSPALLVRRVETSRAEKSADRPPILAPPPMEPPK